MLDKMILYIELFISYVKYMIEYYWNKYVKHYIISNKFRIIRVHLFQNGKFIKDISANYARGVNTITWSNIISYRIMKRIDKMNKDANSNETDNNYFLFVEYSYLGEMGSLLLHEKENLQLPLYSGYTVETLKRNDKDRARIIGTVLQYADCSSTDVTIEEDIDKELHQFCGIRKNFHVDVSNYHFHVRDFVEYLLYKKKIHHEWKQMRDIRVQVSDYMLNDYVFGICDTFKF